jgi:hypothetical protein
MTDAELAKVPGITEVAVAQLDPMRRAQDRSGLERVSQVLFARRN